MHSQDIGFFSSVRHEFNLTEWAINRIKCWLVAFIIFVPLLHQNIVHTILCCSSHDWLQDDLIVTVFLQDMYIFNLEIFETLKRVNIYIAMF